MRVQIGLGFTDCPNVSPIPTLFLKEWFEPLICNPERKLQPECVDAGLTLAA